MPDNQLLNFLTDFMNNLDCRRKCNQIAIIRAEDIDVVLEKIIEAINTINYQQAEIKRLQDNLDLCYKQNMLLNPGIKANAIEEFAARFLKTVHDNHYVLVDQINSKDYGMFTIGIEQAVDETKKEMVGDNNA